jgi:cellulose biosynthesis protein BcsQ
MRRTSSWSDLCLLPARPTLLDIEATAATFGAVQAAKRKAAFVLNQCPPTYRSSRAGEAAKDLTRLGVLAEPMLSARIDFQDAIAAGLGVTEHAREGRAAQEIEALWGWVRAQLEGIERETRAPIQPDQRAASLRERLAGVARARHLSPNAGPPVKNAIE